MIYCFDIDGTICSNTNGEYDLATPFEEVIQKINSLYDNGEIIKIMTARGASSQKDHTKLTKKQLSEWGVKYHELKFGKPYDLIIDDKALNSKDWK